MVYVVDVWDIKVEKCLQYILKLHFCMFYSVMFIVFVLYSSCTFINVLEFCILCWWSCIEKFHNLRSYTTRVGTKDACLFFKQI